jgi:NitT/TauT family transport system ATP-binding protein
VILVTHDLREATFLADTIFVMSQRPGKIVLRKEVDLPRPRELEISYTDKFNAIVYELRARIGIVRKA